MGLKSLAMLNKSGISMYWENVWDSILLYKKYNLSFFYINEIIYFFLNENTYYYNISILSKKGFFIKSYLGYGKLQIDRYKPTRLKYYYLGKILILLNQGWVIILVNFFTAKKKKLIHKYELNRFDKVYLKRFYKNIFNDKAFNNKYIYWHYKNKF